MGRTSDHLEEGYRISKETEEIGLSVIDNLQRDRETLNRIRGRVCNIFTSLSYIPCYGYSIIYENM